MSLYWTTFRMDLISTALLVVTIFAHLLQSRRKGTFPGKFVLPKGVTSYLEGSGTSHSSR